VAVWSIAVAGVVRALVASGDGVLVALEDGDAYRIDARTAAVIALPGLGLAWRAAAGQVDAVDQTAAGRARGAARAGFLHVTQQLRRLIVSDTSPAPCFPRRDRRRANA